MKFSYFLLLVVSFWACNKSSDPDNSLAAIQSYVTASGISYQKTASNVYYLFTQTNSTGRKAQLGEEVRFHIIISDLNGKEYVNSVTKPGTPLAYTYGVAGYLFTGLDEGMALMRLGEKATFLIPASLAYGSNGNSSVGIPGNIAVKCDVTMVNIRSEAEQIADYFTAKSLLSQSSNSGLRYVITKSVATGSTVAVGQTAQIRYTGRLLDDFMFDSNADISKALFAMKVGAGNVIAGFDEAVRLLKVGEKGTFVFPSNIGYGTAGSGQIPPYAPLVFEIEVISAQ